MHLTVSGQLKLQLLVPAGISHSALLPSPEGVLLLSRAGTTPLCAQPGHHGTPLLRTMPEPECSALLLARATFSSTKLDLLDLRHIRNLEGLFLGSEEL